MFQNIHDLLGEGDTLHLTITRATNGSGLKIHALPKGKILNQLPGIAAEGTPAELEAGFVKALSEYKTGVQAIDKSLKDLEAATKELEAANKAKAAAKKTETAKVAPKKPAVSDSPLFAVASSEEAREGQTTDDDTDDDSNDDSEDGGNE